MSTIIPKIVNDLTIITESFTQPGGGGQITPTFTGPPPALNTNVLLHYPTTGVLIGYFTPTQIVGNILAMNRVGTQGIVDSTSIPAGAIMVGCAGFDKQAFQGFDVDARNSDSSTIIPADGWVIACQESIDLSPTLYQKTSIVGWMKVTTTVDGSWRLRIDGGGHSNEDLLSGSLPIAIDHILPISTSVFWDPIDSGNTGYMYFEVSTAAGTIVYKAGTNLQITTYLDE